MHLNLTTITASSIARMSGHMLVPNILIWVSTSIVIVLLQLGNVIAWAILLAKVLLAGPIRREQRSMLVLEDGA